MRDTTEHVVALNGKACEKLLKPYDFLRVHKSYIINMQQVKEYRKETVKLVMTSGEEVTIAKRRKQEVVDCLKMYYHHPFAKKLLPLTGKSIPLAKKD